MFALLAVLANVAIAVVSAQDPAVFNTSAILFGNGISATSDCGTAGPPSCSLNSPPQDGCCYESPGVRHAQPLVPGRSVLTNVQGVAAPNTGTSIDEGSEPSSGEMNMGAGCVTGSSGIPTPPLAPPTAGRFTVRYLSFLFTCSGPLSRVNRSLAGQVCIVVFSKTDNSLIAVLPQLRWLL